MNHATFAVCWLSFSLLIGGLSTECDDAPKYPAPTSPGAELAREPDAPGKGEPAKPTAFRAPMPVTRRDMASAYLALERALRDKPPAGERVAQVNKDFDSLTMLFFSGNFSEAIKRVEAMRLGVLELKPTDDETLLASLKVSVSPETIERNKPASVAVRVTSLYPIEKREPRALRVVVLGASRALGKENSPSIELVPDAGGAIDVSVKIEGPWSDVVAGSVKLRLIAGNASRDVDVGLVASDGSLESSKQTMLARLDAIKNDKLKASVRAVRSRVELISEKRSNSNSAQFLSDPVTIMGEAEHEIVELGAGRDPFVGRTGGYWRVFGVEEPLIAARVFVPPSDDIKAPRAVVMALHGAGGDESMFIEGYGAGKLVELAREKNFIVVAPRTEHVATRADALDLILDQLEACYAIDRSRVYIIGHSMGAMAAAAAAARHPDKLAGVVCIAGGPPRVPEGKIAPMLVMAAQLDPLFPPKRLEQGARLAQERGLPVEVQVVPNFGHTLVVGARLPQAVEWLFQRKLEGR